MEDEHGIELPAGEYQIEEGELTSSAPERDGKSRNLEGELTPPPRVQVGRRTRPVDRLDALDGPYDPTK